MLKSTFLALALSAIVLASCSLAAPLLSTSSWEVDGAASTAFAAAPLSIAWKFLTTFTNHPLFEQRMIQTCSECQPYWTTELGKHFLFMRGINFIDLTGDYERGPAYMSLMSEGALAPHKSLAGKLPKKVAHHDQLTESIFKNISDAGPRANLKEFTSFRTRYYRSSTGRESQAWLLKTVKNLAKQRSDLNISVSEWPHAWGQNSIILHIDGSDSKASQEEGITIVGAHQDSTNLLPFLAAPGADDDGSGTVTILEALRALLTNKDWKPITDVEFHWYSAEEGGLLGSQEVVRGYADRNAVVKGMLQQDMTAFVKQGTEERVGLPTDFIDEELREFVQLLIKEYLDIPAVDTKLGYAASDHASWNKAGYRSVFAIEAPFDDCNLRRIHTTSDTFDHPEFSFDHLVKFVKLTSAFIVELSGWEK